MDPSWTSQTFNMLGALSGVLLLIFAAAWLMRRLQQGQGASRGHLRIVSVLPLSTKERIILLQAGDEQVLMGVSGAGIQHLHTLKEPINPDQAELGGRAAPPLADFASQLKNMMSRSRT
jgi:flagellar protein FliO/FliZ